ncbi:hypothetical protein FHS52_001055 [Erythromicrobium ramosum]|uniref:Uncharacterized protein n=1 Tax=Erythrobacter ramosus TaxID=35811 RepID=A0A6I4UEC8_9SPHN|nr:hypothetical protein [Erythrobacter ramosus]MBB3775112.1 hypothetical protein [Erythrobacter ramosus]MXP37260.1 hypothetical protein [Erythrobacter ramosus]
MAPCNARQAQSHCPLRQSAAGAGLAARAQFTPVQVADYITLRLLAPTR